MIEKPIKVLLVEDQPDDIRLLEEALGELGENRYTRGWSQASTSVQVDSVQEAIETVGKVHFDVILVDVALLDREGLPAFRSLAEVAPVVMLASIEEERLAISLVRQGAQDYLIKSELDCKPLAHSLRCAMERNRLRLAMQQLSFVDDLTGLYNQAGFLYLAGRDWKLAQITGQRLFLVLIGLGGDDPPPHSSQESDLMAIQTSEILRDCFQVTDLLARVPPTRFLVLAFETQGRNAKDEIAAFQQRVNEYNGRESCGFPLTTFAVLAIASPGPESSLEDVLQAAERALCENRRSKIETEIKEYDLAD